MGDLRPVYHISGKGGLKPSEELVELATKLRIAHAVEEAKERGMQRKRVNHRYNRQGRAPLETLRSRRDPTIKPWPGGHDPRE